MPAVTPKNTAPTKVPAPTLATTVRDGMPDNMHFFAELSDLVYEGPSVIRPRLNKMGIGYDHEFEFFANPSRTAEGFGLSSESDLILCFRGTEATKVKDWLADIDFWQAQFPMVDEQGKTSIYEVHGGFWEALSGVWGHMVQWLEAKGVEHKRVWICGHSLGGALASLALVRLHKRGWGERVQGLYTYGCPRNVGDELSELLNERFKGRAFRVVNDEDIVATVPPDMGSVEPFDFSHYGTLVLFDDKGRMRVDGEKRWAEIKNGRGEKGKPGLASQILGGFMDMVNVAEKLTDHSMKHYKRLSAENMKNIDVKPNAKAKAKSKSKSKAKSKTKTGG